MCWEWRCAHVTLVAAAPPCTGRGATVGLLSQCRGVATFVLVSMPAFRHGREGQIPYLVLQLLFPAHTSKGQAAGQPDVSFAQHGSDSTDRPASATQGQWTPGMLDPVACSAAKPRLPWSCSAHVYGKRCSSQHGAGSGGTGSIPKEWECYKRRRLSPFSCRRRGSCKAL